MNRRGASSRSSWRFLAISFAICFTAPLASAQATGGSGNITCYDCRAFEGLESPTCLHPVSRNERTITCPGGPPQNRCMKFVGYVIGRQGDQLLKTWVMQRGCYIPTDDMIFNFTTTPRCGECRRAPGSITLYPRQNKTQNQIVPKPWDADDLVVQQRSVCVCCTNLCNVEDGFNLTRLEKSRRGGGRGGQDGRSQQLPYRVLLALIIVPMQMTVN